jgi:hypothetical protein
MARGASGDYLWFKKTRAPPGDEKPERARRSHTMTKNKLTGGQKTEGGIYWNKGSWDLVTLSGKAGGVLPGASTQEYVRVPTLALLAVAPLMGASYVVFLPFIGFAMLAEFLGKKAGASVKDGVVHMVGVLSPEWRPGEAYFLGRRKKGAKGTATKAGNVKKSEEATDTKKDGKK